MAVDGFVVPVLIFVAWRPRPLPLPSQTVHLPAPLSPQNIVVSTFFHFANLYQQHLSHKRAQLIAYLTNLQGFLTLYRTPTPLSAEEESRRLKLRLDGKAEEEENTVPKSLERYSAGVEIVIASAQSSISSHLEHIKNRYALDPPLPRYSYGPPPEPAESEVKSDFKDVRRWMDATKRLCESEAYFSATSAYGLGGAGGYWSGSSTSEEKSKVSQLQVWCKGWCADDLWNRARRQRRCMRRLPISNPTSAR